ncbi:MAG TPA: hypothetical protein VLV15_01615, partial [Dongiaceae bacterium]|nr:hypothetical protein [Dongiaceae bacterium]
MRSRDTTFVKRVTGRLVAIAAGCMVAATAHAATYYSQGSLAPNLTASWNSARDGSGVAPADFATGDAFVIQNA